MTQAASRLTIIEEIASVMGDAPPQRVIDLETFAKKAINLHRNRWSEMSIEARKYLSEAAAAVRTNKIPPVPVDFIEKTKATKAKADNEPDFEDAADLDDDVEPIPDGLECKFVPQVYTIGSLIPMLESEQLKLPDFQRKFVWTREYRQAFLRSVVAGIPTPSIMLAIDSDENSNQDRYILDGFQRLTTLSLFKSNKEHLGKGIKGLMNKHFAELPGDIRNKFDFTNLTVVETHTKRDNWSFIFRMINKNGMQLTAMELRRAAFPLEIIMMLDEFTEHHQQWITMHGKNSRHRGLASILQAIACHYLWKIYRKPMDQFMDTFCKHVKHGLLQIDVNQLKKDLDLLIEALYHSLGREAFRYDVRRAANHGLLNSMVHAGLTIIEQRPKISVKQLGELMVKTRTQMLDDEIIRQTLAKDTTGKDHVMLRMGQMDVIIHGLLNKGK